MIKNEAGVANNWYWIGIKLLNSNTNVLDKIKEDHRGSGIDNLCLEMFKKWLETPTASWNQLIAALESLELHNAAETVRGKVFIGINSTF